MADQLKPLVSERESDCKMMLDLVFTGVDLKKYGNIKRLK